MSSVTSLLNEKRVFVNLHAENKQQVLNTLILSFRDEVSDEELKAIREAVFTREKIMSTGVGKGLAIPHGKAEGVTKHYGAFAVLETPIDYDSVDNSPVSIIFMLTGPKSGNRSHIKMLSRISRLMNKDSFREQLKNNNSSIEILNLLQKYEQVYYGG